MDYAAFAGSPSGTLIPTTHGQRAFVPNPLPPALDGSALWSDLAATMGALGTLNGLGKRIPGDPYSIIRPLQRREALTSSSMEGTHASPDDLVLLESGAEQPHAEATQEVLNYITALDEATESLKSLPISHRLITAAHRRLLTRLSNLRGSNKLPGEYKQHQNFIGGKSIDQARFIPAPPAEAQAAMDELERYINADSGLPPLIDAALIHYQFETIHPFADGNGRVGRMLIPLYLKTKGALEVPLLYVSPYIEDHKDEYIDTMFEVSRTGDWNGWIRFFLGAVKATCEDTVETIDLLISLQEQYRKTAMDITKSPTAGKIVDSLFARPVLTIPRAAEIAGVTYPPAAAAIDRLVKAGILFEFGDGAQPKRYIAREVVMISAGIRQEELAAQRRREANDNETASVPAAI